VPESQTVESVATASVLSSGASGLHPFSSLQKPVVWIFGRMAGSRSPRPSVLPSFRPSAKLVPPTTPSADFCTAVRPPYGDLSLVAETQHRSPEVRSAAFIARPSDLPPRSLIVVDFAIGCSLVRPGRPLYPLLVHRAAILLHASFRPRLAATPLRFANPSPLSGWIEDFHLQAADHARHTANGSRECAPDDRLSEAIHSFLLWRDGLLRCARNDVITRSPRHTLSRHRPPTGRPNGRPMTGSGGRSSIPRR
jgi:hypothetical protein